MPGVGLSFDSSDSGSGDDGADSSVSSGGGFENQQTIYGRTERLLTWDRTVMCEEDGEASRIPPLLQQSITMSRPPTECSSLPDMSFSSRSLNYPSRQRRRIEVLPLENFSRGEGEVVEAIMHPQTRRPKKTSRLLVLVSAIVIVCFSQVNRTNSAPRRDMSDLRRAEIAFPPLSDDRSREKRLVGSLPKYYLPKIETAKSSQNPPPMPTGTSTSDALSEDEGTVRRHRTTFALARSQHSLPVFGQQHQEVEKGKMNPTMEKFYFDSTADQDLLHLNSRISNNNNKSTWTTLLAWMALVAVILEIGWKEYHRCQMDATLERERRL